MRFCGLPEWNFLPSVRIAAPQNVTRITSATEHRYRYYESRGKLLIFCRITGNKTLDSRS